LPECRFTPCSVLRGALDAKITRASAAPSVRRLQILEDPVSVRLGRPDIFNPDRQRENSGVMKTISAVAIQ
jgi:hypothetical protein